MWRIGLRAHSLNIPLCYKIDQVEMSVHAQTAREIRSPISKWEPRSLSPATSAHLDAIRAIAACAVMWDHLRALFFVDFPHVQNASPLLKIIYFFTGFGYQAVVVFFVLSGFLISSAILKREASGTWSWRDYAIDRSSRLWVVLIPGLLFGLLWDKLGGSYFADTGLYTNPLVGFGSEIAKNNLTVGAFFGNLFFVQTILCPTFGSNGPLWSLANEFWYYVLFPLILFAALAWARKSIPAAISLTVLAAGVAFFIKGAILSGFLIWIAGTILVVAYSRFALKGKIWPAAYLLISSCALFVCLYAARTEPWVMLGSDIAVGIAFTLFLFGILQMDFETRGSSYPAAAHTFAGFSYSLYVLHFPFLLFLKAWLVPSQRWQPDGEHLIYGVMLGAAALVFAWLVSLFTENKTRVARNWMRKAILRSGNA
jgi:peptidoglycan/LPS O-acetylase OafA/YrhL